MRKSRLARKSAIQLGRERARQYYRKLLEYGEVDEKEAKNYLQQLSRTVTKRRRSLEREIDERVMYFVETMHLPTRTDLERISRKVDAINKKLDAQISARGKKKAKK